MKKILFVYPGFQRHAAVHPELLEYVPCNEYMGPPSLGFASIAAMTPKDRYVIEFRDDRITPADTPTDADLVAFSFFTAAATRGLELIDYFRRDQGKLTVAGGIFPTMMPQVVEQHANAVVVGEGERAWLEVLKDLETGQLKPRYHTGPVANLAELPAPDISVYLEAHSGEFTVDDYPLQVSRGCAMSCHACVLPTSMGNSLRPYPISHVVEQLDRLAEHGKHASLTEDTSWMPGPGRKVLEAMFDHLIANNQRAAVSYIGTSLPMIFATPRRLLEKAKLAGVDMYYLVTGFDPISMRAWTGKDDRQLERAKRAIQKAHDVGIEPYTSFLYGSDWDDEGTVDRILEFCEETKIEKAEFAIATPYPGTPQWHQLVAEDRLLHRDWYRYNDANPTFKPKQLTPDQVEEGYLRLWREFYTGKEHLLDKSHYERTIQF